MKTPIRLVCLDFDGTIMLYDDPSSGHFHPDVIDLLNELDGLGVHWCTNSGRDLQDQGRVIELAVLRGLVHKPVALICSESLVYERSNGSFHPLEPWNSTVQREMIHFHRRVQERLEPLMPGLQRSYGMLPSYIGEHYTAYAIPDKDGLPQRFHMELAEILSDIPKTMITRNGGWVAVLTEDLGKGNALRQFAQARGYRAEDILCVGDQFNDLNMLDGKAALHVGCPSNAIPEVIATVRLAGGHVANAQGPHGTIEVIRQYL
ncbi:MAG TPA: HAD hydrolase family protein [Kiritimatiellia bacterium]|jgi:hydroxymethylpyrimidine pyrophosphatase-like HAD family hydrolase